MPVSLPPSYLTVSDADALAATLPGLAGWGAAATPAKTTALAQASVDVDSAMPYQGRPYDPAQGRQFPRVADDPPAGGRAASSGGAPADGTVAGVVWDWDPAANAAVVPTAVLLAVLFQADAILAGGREPRLAAQHDGVVYELTGTLAESFKRTTGPGVTTGLCRKAWTLMRAYRLRAGRMV